MRTVQAVNLMALIAENLDTSRAFRRLPRLPHVLADMMAQGVSTTEIVSPMVTNIAVAATLCARHLAAHQTDPDGPERSIGDDVMQRLCEVRALLLYLLLLLYLS